MIVHFRSPHLDTLSDGRDVTLTVCGAVNWLRWSEREHATEVAYAVGWNQRHMVTCQTCLSLAKGNGHG